MSSQQSVRHIVSLSGGKDSTALSIYLRDRIPDWNTFFAILARNCPKHTSI